MSDRVRTTVIFVVTTIWAANFTAGLVMPSYNTSESINGIFMAIVGGLFALGAREGHDEQRHDDKGDSDDKDEPPNARHRKG